MFKNKHVVVAMLVAPLLAITAWFAVDFFIGERPHIAKAGGEYTLIAKSNCRYASGQCDLENAEFKLTLRPVETSAIAVSMRLDSVFMLQSATIGLVENGSARVPVAMVADNESAKAWQGKIQTPHSESSILRVAVTARGSTYFAEIPVIFLNRE